MLFPHPVYSGFTVASSIGDLSVKDALCMNFSMALIITGFLDLLPQVGQMTFSVDFDI